ncbi:hypothetical protein KIPB_012462, partial [Kipferlia bialata]
ILFILDYCGFLGSGLVICVFSHFSYLTISAGVGRRRRTRRPVDFSKVFKWYFFGILAILCGMTYGTLGRGLVNTNVDCDEMSCMTDPDCDYCWMPCWFVDPDWENPTTYARNWFTYPGLFLSVLTLFMLTLGFMQLFSTRRGQRPDEFEGTKRKMYRFFWLSYPIPIMRGVPPLLLNAYYKYMINHNIAQSCSPVWWYITFNILCQPVAMTAVAYAVPRIIFETHDAMVRK